MLPVEPFEFWPEPATAFAVELSSPPPPIDTAQASEQESAPWA